MLKWAVLGQRPAYVFLTMSLYTPACTYLLYRKYPSLQPLNRKIGFKFVFLKEDYTHRDLSPYDKFFLISLISPDESAHPQLVFQTISCKL